MKLFKPINLGNCKIKNRIVLPAMSAKFASEEGYVTERMKDYYEERAKGGAGLIIVEFTAIERRGKTSPFQLMIDNDRFIPGLKRLSSSIKRHGAKAAIQIQHGGVKASAKVNQIKPVGPSDFPHYPAGMGPAPRPLKVSEIRDLVVKFGEAARRAKEAGFDAIELHCTHSYLVDQFMSPRFNKRTDEYGGNIENRARFACEIIECVKEKSGEDYPVICRITGDDYVEGGITLKDAKENARLMTKSGADCIHVSVGISDNMVSTPPMSFPKGCFVHLAHGVKEAVDVPVIAVGRINDIFLAEQVLTEEKANLIAMGRALIADPFLPKKAEKGELEDIVPCIYCNQGCISRVLSGLPMSCLVNPRVGKEKEYRIKPAKVKKKVLIVGSGPAGMEAARILKLRGHKAILHEKEDRLGGQLNLAWIPPHKEEIKRLLDYYERQIEKLKIEVHLGSEVTLDILRDLAPDAIIMATGVSPNIPDIPGINGRNVSLAVDVIEGKVKVKGKVLVLGSRRVALETAELLYDQSHDVTVIARAGDIGLDLHPRDRMFLMKRYSEKQIKVITKALVREIMEQGLTIEMEGEEQFLNADHIILAWGSIPNRSLMKELENLAPECGSDVYVAGDCIEPRNILEAIYDAARIAREI